VTLGALFGVAAALGLIVALLGLAVRALRRYGGVGVARAGRLPLEVVTRIGLTPRQGLAVVRIGGRGVVVSVGEGGVRPVLELTAEECAGFTASGKPGRRHGAPGDEVNAGDEGDAGGEGAAAYAASGDAASAATWDRIRAALRRSALVALLAVPFLLAGAEAALAQGVGQGVAGQGGSTAAVGAAALAPGAGVSVDSVAAALLPRLDLRLGGDGNAESGLRLRGTVGTVIVIGLLTLLPTLLLLMTSFTRILVVLHFLRQALGTQSAPPGHLLAALALLLTGFVMAPTLQRVNDVALQPWVAGELEEGEMLKAAVVPLREFMLLQTPERDLGTFLELSESPELESADEVPLTVLLSAFATSELRTAFQIGFAIFLPFIVIDLVVAAVLTSMGMFMLPPAMIALPCKLLLFVLVDGWTLVVQSLVQSFR
jgi:flagellar biosynthetic protein FliP